MIYKCVVKMNRTNTDLDISYDDVLVGYVKAKSKDKIYDKLMKYFVKHKRDEVVINSFDVSNIQKANNSNIGFFVNFFVR